MRSQLSGRWFSSNWVGTVVVFVLLFKLRGGEGGGGGGGRRGGRLQEVGGRIQEEGDECSACNKETTGVKPPPRALRGPDRDTCCHAGDTQFRFQSCFVMPPIRKHEKKH